MSLMQNLLDGAPETSRPAAPAPRRRPTVTEAEVLRRVKTASGRPMSLSAEESRVLAGVVRLYESDPFAAGGGKINTSDLESMGLDVAGAERVDARSGAFEDDEPRDTWDAADGKLIPISSAVVAPNATPGHDEPIPDSVLAAMDAISGITARPVSEIAAADPEYGGEPTAPSRRPEPEPAAEEDEDFADVAASMVSGDGSEDYDNYGESVVVSRQDAGDPGLDPASLAETMRRLRGQKRQLTEARPQVPARGPVSEAYARADANVRRL